VFEYYKHAAHLGKAKAQYNFWGSVLQWSRCWERYGKGKRVDYQSWTKQRQAGQAVYMYI